MAPVNPLTTFPRERAGDLVASSRFDGPLPDGSLQCETPDGRSPQVPDRARSPVDAPAVRLVFPPWMEPLPSSTNFYGADFEMVFSGVVGEIITSPELTLTLKKSQVGWFQNLSLYVLAPVAAFKGLWTLKINGGSVPGYTRLRNPPFAGNVMYNWTNDMRIRLPPAAKVQITIENRSAVAATVGAEMGGWFHSLIAEEQMWGRLDG